MSRPTATTPTATSPTATWPPRPPVPPEPPFPPHPQRSPWLPEHRPAPSGPVTASAALILGADPLTERLLDQRLVILAGELDGDAVNRAVAELALLDAAGEERVRLRLANTAVDLDGALTLVDALDLVSAPVHATALGAISGPAVAVLAVADVRTAAPHATLRLSEPRPPRSLAGRELPEAATEFARRLRQLQERLAAACGRTAEEIADDMRPGKVLGAREAEAYGLVDGQSTRRLDTPGERP